MICVGGGPIYVVLFAHSKIAGLATDVQQTTGPGYGKDVLSMIRKSLQCSPVGIGEKMSDDEHLVIQWMDRQPAP